MRRAATILALTGAALLSACGSSPPTKFYVLTPAPAARRAGAAGAPIQVAAVHLPEELDRLEMVSPLGPNRLDVRGEDRWAAPLDDMSRRVLTQDLEQRLPAGAVVSPRTPQPQGARKLVVDLQDFGLDASGGGRLQGTWSLIGPNRKPALRRPVDLHAAAAGAAPQSQAAAMSRLLGDLADAIAEEAGAPPATTSAGPAALRPEASPAPSTRPG